MVSLAPPGSALSLPFALNQARSFLVSMAAVPCVSWRSVSTWVWRRSSCSCWWSSWSMAPCAPSPPNCTTPSSMSPMESCDHRGWRPHHQSSRPGLIWANWRTVNAPSLKINPVRDKRSCFKLLFQYKFTQKGSLLHLPAIVLKNWKDGKNIFGKKKVSYLFLTLTSTGDRVVSLTFKKRSRWD